MDASDLTPEQLQDLLYGPQMTGRQKVAVLLGCAGVYLVVAAFYLYREE
jgi:hypothetical protein